MKVTQHLQKAESPPISFEIVPQLRGNSLKKRLDVIEDLARYNPPFIDITSHSAQIDYEEKKGNIKKKVHRKRPGTVGLSVRVQHSFGIDAVPHVLCHGFTKEETEDFLLELHSGGIQNVLALRGDMGNYEKPLSDGRTRNNRAIDLVKQIKTMNQGKLLQTNFLMDEPTDFCIGVAGYPEKHFEAPNLKTDISYLKEKINAGAEYVVTQMFFDNKKYFSFVEACRDQGILVPIIPGLKILTTKKQLTTIPSNFYVDMPETLVEKVMDAKTEDVKKIGVEWTKNQIDGLLKYGVPGIHIYVMGNSEPVKELMNFF